MEINLAQLERNYVTEISQLAARETQIFDVCLKTVQNALVNPAVEETHPELMPIAYAIATEFYRNIRQECLALEDEMLHPKREDIK